MIPIKFPGMNATFTAEGCADLPAYVVPGGYYIQSVWELTEGELVKILRSSKIRLTIRSKNQPQVNLEVIE